MLVPSACNLLPSNFILAISVEVYPVMDSDIEKLLSAVLSCPPKKSRGSADTSARVIEPPPKLLKHDQ